MTKIYTIQITGSIGKPNIWYANKIGKQFEAKLVCKQYNGECFNAVAVFEVNPCQFVYQIDCIVISEKLFETYKR